MVARVVCIAPPTCEAKAIDCLRFGVQASLSNIRQMLLEKRKKKIRKEGREKGTKEEKNKKKRAR